MISPSKLKMTGAAVRTLVTIAAVVPIACNCGPKALEPVPDDAAQRYAEAVCDAAARCGCVAEVFPGSRDQCVSDRVERFQTIASWVPDVEFSQDCFEKLLDRLKSDTCVTTKEWAPPGSSYCRVFKGTLKAGEACSPAHYDPGGDMLTFGPDNGGLSVGPCAEPLSCFAGTCLDPNDQPRVGVGDACGLSTAALCDSDPPTTYCGRDGICHERGDLGDSCDVPFACTNMFSTEYCAGISPDDDQEGTCTQRIPVGGACDPATPVTPCAGYGYCSVSGKCVAGPWPAVCAWVHRMPGDDSATWADWIPK